VARTQQVTNFSQLVHLAKVNRQFVMNTPCQSRSQLFVGTHAAAMKVVRDKEAAACKVEDLLKDELHDRVCAHLEFQSHAQRSSDIPQ
jgi:hypothetical protein